MNTAHSLHEIAARLESSGYTIANSPVVAGFDAFVDQLFHIVGSRQSPESYQRMENMRDFGAWATASVGRSGLREAVLAGQEAGGCTVHQGDALASLGFPLHAFTGVGSEPVFDVFREKCSSLETLGLEPGRTVAYEFHDGKLMFCSFSHFARLTPDYLKREFSRSSFREACAGASAIVLTSWSVYPHMNACWRYLQNEVFNDLSHRPRLFFDLADPASRSTQDLAEMFEVLAGFTSIGPVTLSLNGNEAGRLAKAIGVKGGENSEELASILREWARIDELGIHHIKSATSSTSGGAVTVSSAHTASPRKSVGAGDRFNAGWLAGSLLDLPQASRLLLGAACSGFFVRNARSATLPELTRFLRTWADGGLKEKPL